MKKKNDNAPAVLVKPIPIWKKPVRVDVKSLFVAVGKAAVHSVTLNPEKLGEDVVGAVASLGLDVSVEELAYVFVQRSLLQAMLNLTRESLSHFDKEQDHFELLSAEVDKVLTKLTIKIDEDFLKNPGKSKFVTEVVRAYAQWMCDLGVSPRSAELLSARLPAYFVFSLASEWKRNSAKYSVLTDLTSSPFSLAVSYERGWSTYFAYLEKRVNENVFDEAFSLAQIYVPLNASYVERSNSHAAREESFLGDYKNVVVDLEREIREWIKSADKNDAIRVLSGGPGSGKSSFTKILCARLARDGLVKPLYIPLHLIDPTMEVDSEVARFVRDEGLLGFNPLSLEFAGETLLLVFDGLDELASQGKVAAQVAKDFVRAVERMVERRNLGQNPIFVLVSGRELVIQENETEFRRPRQILCLLPYFVPNEHRSEYSDPEGLLKKDLRETWWKNYGKLSGASYLNMPRQLKIREIDEITAQPLLNYLVALSYGRGRLNFDKRLNLNSIYADLVAAVHERGYEKSRVYRPISHIRLVDFVRVLEEIGLAAWHGSDGRSTSVNEILHHCRQSGLEALVKSFTEGAEAGVTKLLAAFFFRRNGENVGGDAAFVFTHKSFGEYLTGARIARGIARIVTERTRRIASPDDGFDISDALVHWVRLVGPAEITGYLQEFLRREIQQRSDSELELWQKILIELMSSVVDRHFPVEKLGVHTFSNSFRYDLNASVALLIALNACSQSIKKVARIDFSSSTSFGSFLRRVCVQRAGPSNPPLMSALSYLDLSGQHLDLIDFYGANLECCNFAGVELHFANFGQANLTGVDFSSASLVGSRFGGIIRHVNFSQARLSGAIFEHPRISNVRFVEADLNETRFEKGVIEDADFSGAALRSSNLYEVEEVRNLQFEGAAALLTDQKLIEWCEEHRSNGRLIGNLRVYNEPPQSRRRKVSRGTAKEEGTAESVNSPKNLSTTSPG